MQASNPTFRAGFKGGDIFCGEAQAHHLVKKLSGFSGSEAQVGRAQFGQLAPGAQLCQGERWILAGGDNQVHLRRQVLHQKAKRLVHRRGINHVIIVQRQGESIREGCDLVEQGYQQRFDGRRLRLLERLQHSFSKPGRHRLQCRDDVSQKAERVAIPLVQRDPRHLDI